MRFIITIKVVVIFIFLGSEISLSQSIDLLGQLSGWIIVNNNALNQAQLGIRYIPGLFLEKFISDNHGFDIELSLNMYRSGQFRSLSTFESAGKIKPYRLWLRYARSQFEVRFGLQKINFGSATQLRPLMWFDRIDPRDPLQLTDGVYGLLFRYYFLNNANIWLWGLYGNEDTKGWEIIPSDDKSIEYGGRIQYPLWTGEIALTFHYRRMDLRKGLFVMIPIGNETLPENRFGLDGKWDVGVGLWFEGVLIHQKTDLLPINYQKLLNVGLDYTFGLGNGLYISGEHLIIEASDRPFESGETTKLSAIALTYPFGLLDQVMGILYYAWESHDPYRFLSWKRTYDKWSLYVVGFWNPDRNLLYQHQAENNYFMGKGVQILVVFNH